MQAAGSGKTSFPAAYQFADTFQPSEQAIWKAIYFQTYQVGVLAAGAEWVITSIKIHSARGQWIFCVTTYLVLSSLNACKFFSCAYIQSVTLGQLWEAQESSPEVWFLLPCCLGLVLGCGAGGVMGGSSHRERAVGQDSEKTSAGPGLGVQPHPPLRCDIWTLSTQMGCPLVLLCNNCTRCY